MERKNTDSEMDQDVCVADSILVQVLAEKFRVGMEAATMGSHRLDRDVMGPLFMQRRHGVQQPPYHA